MSQYTSGNMTLGDTAIALQDHENEIKSLKHRMDECEESQKTLTNLTNSVGKLAVNMEYMAKEQEKQSEMLAAQNARVDRLEKEPTDEYRFYKRTIISCILTTIIGAVLGAVIASIRAKGGL